MDDLVSIGTVARRSGLSLRALRLYDGLGLLRPAHVDPATGYRRYGEDQVAQACLIARLREVDVPLPEVAALLAEEDGPARRRRLERWWSEQEAAAHRRRDLVAALGRHLEEGPALPTTLHELDADVLLPALTAVLRCTDNAADGSVLTGVLVEPTPTGTRLVATDRYRLAVWDLPAHSASGATLVLTADDLRAVLEGLGDGRVVLSATEDAVTLRGAGIEAAIGAVDATFPEYWRLLDGTTVGAATVDRGALRALVAPAVPTLDGEPGAVVLEAAAGGLTVRLGGVDAEPVVVAAEVSDTFERIAFNAAFLLDGLDAFPAAGALRLASTGWSSPLTVEDPAGTGGARYLLMPIRLDADADRPLTGAA